MLEPFLLRALVAALGLALVAAPLGALVVWQRMAYFGETMAQASLLGVALSLAVGGDVTVSVLVVAMLAALLILLLSRQRVLPLDSVLGLLHHGSLAAGVIATAALAGPSVDLLGYLFGDIFAVSQTDLAWIWGGGVLVLGVLYFIWQPLLRLAVHEELAIAEGVPGGRIKAAFMLLLAITIAIAIKILGILLVIAFLIVPAAAARPFARTPEQMVAITALVAVAGVVAGLALSARSDAPGGPAIVLVLAAMAALAMAIAGGFAGVSGALMAPIHAVTPYMGHSIIVTAFVIVIVGGMASIEGAVLAAFLLGFIHTFTTTLFDAVVATMVGVAFMAVVLVIKPSGLLGRVRQ